MNWFVMFPFVFLQNKLIIVSPLENDIKGFNCLCILNMLKFRKINILNKYSEIIEMLARAH